MRRLTPFALALFVALLPMHSADADPRVGPPLHIQLYLYINETTDPPTRTASLAVSGTQCLPQDAPASVIVTLDRQPGAVFTAKPNANGRWFVSIPIELPIDGVYVVNAECDNYFGTTVYPTATTNADDVIVEAVAASGGGTGGRPSSPPTPMPTVITDRPCAFTNSCIANTGNGTGAELGIGFGALAVGLLLLLAGRPRRATRTAISDDIGRHRRTH
jgi:hypothetical protein